MAYIPIRSVLISTDLISTWTIQNVLMILDSRIDINNVQKTIQFVNFILIISVVTEVKSLHETSHLGLDYSLVLLDFKELHVYIQCS